MAAAAQFSQQLAPMEADPLRLSVGQLLSRALNLPCSAAAQAFAQLVQPTARFQLALDVLLPLLDAPVDYQQRILVSYILYSIYAPHPIAINPFKSALVLTFQKEKDVAVKVSAQGGVCENEQLVWVLWKILQGDGGYIGPFTPSDLANSPVPPKLKPANLTIEEPADRVRFDPFGDSTSAEDPSEHLDGASSRDGSHDAQPGSVDIRHDATADADKENEKISEAMSLLLAARDRVLTLSEQRTLLPSIPDLVSPAMITSLDVTPIISTNPAVAYPLTVALLSQPLISPNVSGPSTYLEILKHLPPTLPSFDLIGRLLREPTVIIDTTTGGQTTIADTIRAEVLGWFIHGCITWLDEADEEEKAGIVSDDRYAKGVQNLCRFYTSLVKLGIVDPASHADSAEMAHFTLRTSHIEEANSLYRLLVQAQL